MALGSLDSNGIGRYVESTPIGTKFSDYLNLALETVSAAFTTLKNRVTALETSAFVILYRTSSLALTTTESAIPWTSEEKDVGGMHNNGVNPSRVTITKAGTYLVSCSVYNSNTAGTGILRLQVDGANVPGAWTRRDGTATAGTPLSVVYTLPLTVGQYIEALVAHSTAAGNISGTGDGRAHLSVLRISD